MDAVATDEAGAAVDIAADSEAVTHSTAVVVSMAEGFTVGAGSMVAVEGTAAVGMAVGIAKRR
jgi:hypothetical protein